MDYSLNLYWSLHVDFIEAFKCIKYKDIPLALVMDFSLNEVRKELDDPLLTELTKNKIKSAEQIQPCFNRFIEAINRDVKTTAEKEGHILFYEHLLRFPDDVWEKYFDPEHTLILTHTTKSERCGIKKIPLDDYIDHGTDRQQIKEDLKAEAEKLFSSYQDHPVFKKAECRNKFLSFIPPIIDIIDKIDNFFTVMPVSCVIIGKTGGMNPINRVLPLAAAKRGIPSICMQHGLIMSREDFWMPVFTSKLAVYGDYEKEWYIKRGVAKEMIEVIGHPRFDNIFHRTHLERTIFKKKAGLDQKKKCVLIATQPMKIHIPLWTRLIEALLHNRDIEIIIKPHPIEEKRKRLSKYNAILSKYPTVKMLGKDYDLYDILFNSDMVVINSTTVGLEALLFDKPLFILTNENRKYYERKLTDFLNSDPEALARQIMQYLEDEDYRHELDRKRREALHYYYPQKTAGQKLVDLIHRVTGKEARNG